MEWKHHEWIRESNYGTLRICKQTLVKDIDFKFEQAFSEEIGSSSYNYNFNINRVNNDQINIHPRGEINDLLIDNESIKLESNLVGDNSCNVDLIKFIGSENIFNIFIKDNGQIRPASWECQWIID